MAGNKISWIVFTSDEFQVSQLVNQELGLRPDTNLLAVVLFTNGAAILERWSGVSLNLTYENARNSSFYWAGIPVAFPEAVGTVTQSQFNNQFLSVAVVDVSIFIPFKFFTWCLVYV
jgi:hypothetical protein